jgi:hypothetical protein
VSRIYIAAMYSQMEQMRGPAAALRERGHEVTARWIDGAEATLDETSDGAAMDLDDIDRADCVLSFTQPKGTMFKGGGRHVEYGYAIAKRKRLIIVGERENIFHHLPYAEVYATFERAVAALEPHRGVQAA